MEGSPAVRRTVAAVQAVKSNEQEWGAPAEAAAKDASKKEAGGVGQNPASEFQVGIRKDGADIWPMQAPGQSHDMTVFVRKNDKVLFICRRPAGGKSGAILLWGLRLTYVETGERR
jgi:hypothetical protein